jgi:hypothetical protein
MIVFVERVFETEDEREAKVLQAHEWYGSYIKEIGVHDQFKKALSLTIPEGATMEDIREALLVAQIKESGMPPLETLARPNTASEEPAMTATSDIIDRRHRERPAPVR